MLGFLGSPMKLNDVIAILGIFSAAGSLYVFATLKDITGDAVSRHNEDQYSHPILIARNSDHDRQIELISRDIAAVNATIVHNQQMWAVVQNQNEKNHSEVMAAIRALQTGGR